MKYWKKAFLPTLGLVSLAAAQTGISVVGSGQYTPGVNAMAPGELFTLRVSNLRTLLARPDPDTGFRLLSSAGTSPLPQQLAGISAQLIQHLSNGDTSYQLPMYSILQQDVCEPGNASISPIPPLPHQQDCFLSYITVQIPYEIQVVHGAGRTTPSAFAVTDNGVTSQPFPATPAFVQIHIVTDCDLNPSIPNGTCTPQVLHSDGSAVTAASPAAPGETLTVEIWGLGVNSVQSGTLPAAGNATSDPGPVFNPANFPYSLRFGKNLVPERRPVSAQKRLTPDAVTMVTDQVGLYQMMLTLPTEIPNVPGCGVNGTVNNLTINLGVGTEPGVGICIAAPSGTP